MTYEDFLTAVEQLAGVDRDRAERAAQAVLQTLADRIADGEARDLAAELPPELAPYLGKLGGPEAFDVEEFVRRVAEREDVDVLTALRHTRAVLAVLGRAVSSKEYRDMVAELPASYAPLLPAGPDIELPGADDVLRRVAERAGLDADGARRATAAVLETLAERIAGGEVDDLAERLPFELRIPLRQGKAHTRGKATPLSLDEFLRRVAEREGGASLQAAREHARAVLAVLRETVGDDEFFDASVQLPKEYKDALVPARA